MDGIETLSEDLASASLALARCFARGATLWSTAPSLAPHAHHVAVEFVHPVIMGKRALPAVVVDDLELVATLRALARPGDILVALSTATEPTVCSAMQRAAAWGLTTVWIGEGPRPAPGAADFVLWSERPAAGYSGQFVLLYHVLWELTHICFEHPGLLRQPANGHGADDACVTCSDEGRLAEVVSVGPGERAQVRTPAGVEAVDTSLVGEAHPGDLVVVHAGSALSLVDDVGAARVGRAR